MTSAVTSEQNPSRSETTAHIENAKNSKAIQWRQGVLFPILVALCTLGLGGGVQFLMWGGAVSENLEQLDRRLASLDTRLAGLYPRREADGVNSLVARQIQDVVKQIHVIEGRMRVLESRADR